MNKIKKLKKLIEKPLNLLFPVKCVCCKKLSKNADGEDILCKECREILNIEAARDCVICKSPPHLCVCKKIEYIDNIIFEYFYFGDKLKQSVYSVKKANLYYINEFFAKGMYNSIKICDRININEIDIITNAPRKKDSIKLYGYNQTEVLAKMIARYAKITYMPILEASELYKIEQKSLDSAHRVINVKNKFTLVKNIRKKRDIIKDKNILIIDDIVTTGSTLSECARVIKNIGAKKVYALCAASVYHK